MRYAHTAAPYSDYSLISHVFTMRFDHFCYQSDALLSWHIGESHQARMHTVVQVDEFPEVTVDGEQYPAFGFSTLQQRPVPRVVSEFSSFENVVPTTAQPFR